MRRCSISRRHHQGREEVGTAGMRKWKAAGRVGTHGSPGASARALHHRFREPASKDTSIQDRRRGRGRAIAHTTATAVARPPAAGHSRPRRCHLQLALARPCAHPKLPLPSRWPSSSPSTTSEEPVDQVEVAADITELREQEHTYTRRPAKAGMAELSGLQA